MTNIEYYLNSHYSNSADDGALGKAFECAINEFFTGDETLRIAKQGVRDVHFSYGNKRGEYYEVKTACGEIETLAYATWVIYCPEVNPKIPAEKQGFMFTRKQWNDFISGYGGRGSFVRVDKKRGHAHIQSFYSSTRLKASKSIARYIWDTCYKLPTAEEHFIKRMGSL